MICDKNCANCPFDDCINDEMDAEDFKESMQRDKLLATEEEKRQAAKSRAKYLKKRESCLAYAKAYYRAHKKEAAAYQKTYRKRNRRKIIAYQRAYEQRNREGCGAEQARLRVQREALGLTQKDAARIFGVSPSMVSRWERGLDRKDVGPLIERLQEAVS